MSIFLPKQKRKMGWRREPFDSRDCLYRLSASSIGDLPASVDLRPNLKTVPVEDQGATSSCTAHACTSAMEMLRDANHPHVELSRIFLYFGARYIINEQSQDAGAYIRDNIKVLAKQGVCKESLWPFGMSRLFLQPSNDCFKDALNNKAIEYQKISSLIGVKDALAKGYPVVGGITIFSSFMSDAVAKTGHVPMPRVSGLLRERREGGHAILFCGYDNSMKYKKPGGSGEGCFICMNSWGQGWGDGGYFYLPFPYLQSPELSDDFWTISKAEFK